MESLKCPKCRGQMRSYERNSVTVDQCGECRGIFLDRGELERLVDAELQYNSPSPQPRYEEKRYEEKRRYDDRAYGNQHSRKKKKSFLEELFD
ncbi:zf-TFIIB domain-containing protein [Kribbella sp. NPDC058693]|uniref:TFIIB-type zinc ribbon-containing protein n=1 Tax=Kribbella sp. NPDC058693 TaxID=3346602 RepID=UPI00364D5C2D